MQVDIDIKEMKPNSVLYRNEKGQFICVSKEEFLKEFKNEILDFSNEIANLKSNTENFKKSITGQISNQNKRIAKLSSAILDFIKIMKGESNNEKDN